MIRKILVVDDNEFERKLIKEILNSDYECLFASNGDEALNILRTQHRLVSAIVLNLIMPGKDGFEVLNEIRRNFLYITIPVIINTGLNDDQTKEKAITLGANGFITKPYNRSIFLHTINNLINLKESNALIKTLLRDPLTGLLKKESFIFEAATLVKNTCEGYYTLSCIDVERFKVINDQYGADKGDEILKHMAKSISLFVDKVAGLVCRYSDDRFAILFPTSYKDSKELINNHILVTSPKCLKNKIKIRIGRYLIKDKNIAFNTMFDRAIFAEESIKGRYDTYIIEYSDEMLEKAKVEQNIITIMNESLENKEFTFFLQPQFNHKTKAMIGAEALVRWKRNDKYISPAEFVPVFEKNGFIYELDQYIWSEVCKLLRKWLDAGIKPLPISVNISRVDIFHDDFIDTIINIVDKYNIKKDLLRLEVTESAFSGENTLITNKINSLIDLGFTVEIDDFGSGYSSLNSLKDVKAQILKLDMRFLEKTNNTARSGNIIESVVRMARWLGMAVIAEGVEDQEHADFLKSIGCYYIQGYYYSKPIRIEEYEDLFDKNKKEQKLTRLITVKNLDNNDFWNASSMDTLIFNSYVGGACIFEYIDGKVELLRTNDQFELELGIHINQNIIIDRNTKEKYLSKINRNILFTNIKKAIDEKHESTCEIELFDGNKIEYIRATVREIARTQNRYLIYCVVVNISEQRRAEINEKRIAERMKAIMDNTKSGVTAVIVKENREVEYVLVNDRFYELMGYTREQFRKEVKVPFDRIIPEDYDNTIDELAKLTKVGDTATVNMRALKRDGSMVWLRDDVTIIKLDGIDSLVQLSNFIDISQQAQAEEQEHRMYEQLQAIMKSINGGVTATIVKNGIPTFILANDKYYEQLGYTKEEFEKNNIDKFSMIIEEDRERIHNEFIKNNNILNDYTLEYSIRKPNGEIRNIISRTNVINLIGVKEKVHLCVYNDITDIREMQKREQDLTTQLQSIMNNISGGITASKFIDKDNIQILFSNNYFYEMYGYSKEEWNNDIVNTFELIHPDDVERVKIIVSKIVEEKKPYSYEYRCYKKDGSIIWIQCRNTVIDFNEEKGIILLAVTTDVTDLRMAELKERNSLSTLNAIMNNMSAALVVSQMINNEANYLLINKKYTDLFGYTIEDYKINSGKNFEIVYDEDKEFVSSMIKKALNSNEEVIFEYRIIKKDNLIVWVKQRIITTTIDGIDGTVQLSLLIDVTKEKQNELALELSTDKLKAIMNHVGNGIMVVGLYEKPEYILANDKYYEVIGYSREDYENKKIGYGLQAIHKDDQEKVINMIHDIRKDHLDKTVEYRTLRNDGSLIWVRTMFTITNLRGINAPVLIAMLSDITSEKEKNNQLEFLNNSAHDILAEQDTDKAIYQTLEKVMKYFTADRGYIIEIDYQKGITNNTYEFCEKDIISQKDDLQNIPFSVNDFWYKTFQNNQYLSIEDTDDLDDDYYEIKQLLKQQNIKTIINVPLYEKGNIIGFIGVDNPKTSFNQVSRLMGLSDYFAILLNRRNNEKKIEANYEMIETMMNDTPGGFYRVSVVEKHKPTLIYVNKGLCDMLGYSLKEFKDKFGNNCYGFINNDDLNTAYKVADNKKFEGGQFSTKCRLQKKDGNYIWVMVFGRFVKDEKENLNLNIYLSDITKQKIEEDNQKQLLDNLLCGAALYEYDGTNLNVIHINKQYWKLVGRQKTDYTKTSVFDAILENDRVKVYDEINAAIKQNRNAFIECHILCGDNKYKSFHIEANIKKESNNNNKYLLYTTYVPITEESMSIKQMIPITLSTMMSKSTDIAYVKDINLKYLVVSKPLVAFSGLNNEREILGLSTKDVFEDKIATMFEEIDTEIIRTGKSVIDITEQVKTKSGKELVLSSSKYPIIDTEGNVIGIYGISRDVTEEKRNESQIELINRTIPGGIASYIVDNGVIKNLYFNDGFYNFSGYTKEEYVEMTKIEPLALMFEEDRHLIRELIKKLIDDVFSIQTAYYRCHIKDGTYRWMCLNASITQVNDDQIIVNCLQLDVTNEKLQELELRINEEAYRIAIAHSDQVICKYDISTKRLYFNDKFSKMLSVDKYIENIPYSAVNENKISKETASEYIKFYENIINGQKEGSVVFEKLLNNEFIWVKAVSTTIFDDNNKPLTAIITYKNISEQIEKEAVYNKWQQSLKSKDFYSFKLFTTNLSKNRSYEMIDGGLFEHDFIKTDTMHLNQITKEFVERYVKEEDREKVYNFVDLNRLLTNYYRQERIDIVEFNAKIYNGEEHWIKLTIELIEAVDSNDVLAFFMFEDINEEKKREMELLKNSETDNLTGLLNRNTFISLVKDKMDNSKTNRLSALFMIDVDEFKEINDTYGHSFGDDVLIEISQIIRTTIRESDLICRIGGDEFMIFLNDITNISTVSKKANQLIHTINKTFYPRIKLSMSIGIAIYPNDGNDFNTLYVKADKALYYIKERNKNNFAFYDNQKEKQRIGFNRYNKDEIVNNIPTEKPIMLIVEDDIINSEILKGIFKDKYIIKVTNNGKNALKYVKENAYNISIILLDIGLPDISGYEVLDKIKNQFFMSNTPVIVVSANEDGESIKKAITVGAIDYITKPVIPEIIKLRVNSVMSKSKHN